MYSNTIMTAVMRAIGCEIYPMSESVLACLMSSIAPVCENSLS